jgi:hypothetical protein
MTFFRARNSGGKHATRQAPAAPQPPPAASVPIPPVTPGGWARLTGSIPAALIELTDTHAHLLAGILLNAGEGYKDIAASAPEDAAEAYVRSLEAEVGRLKGQPRWTEKFGPVVACDHPEHLIVQREQVAAYRHMAEGENGGPPAGPDGERM